MSDAEVVNVRVLGPLDVRRSGRSLPVPGAKPRALLTMLALEAGRAVPADVLQSVLWGDTPPATAHKALQTHISALRRALGAQTVVTRGVGWALVAESTDVAEFDAAARAGRAALRAGAADTAAAHFINALHIWRGPPELPTTPRGRAELTRWVETHESIVDARADALLACGQAAELVGELESAVAETPLREQRWAQLCLALFRAGRQGDALHAYQRARIVLADELGVEPGPELRQLEAAILTHDTALDVPPHQATATTTDSSSAPPAGPPLSGSATVPSTTTPLGPAALPAQPTTFVGRHDELTRVRRLLTEHQLVTAVGPGGVGKTRLAVAAAEAMSTEFPAGVVFVDLAAVSAEFVTETVAVTAGIVEQPERPVEAAVHAHFGTGRWLLILDNCEHVVETVSGFAERLSTACPDVVTLATSRERLGTRGEQICTVPPLSVVGPDTDDAKGSEAETLFLDRARAVEPEFDADPELIGEVCTRCDGLPLAIELAAARCASLGIDGLLAGLDDRLRLLVGSRVTTPRHRSLRAVLDWGHDLLDADEQTVFRRVGVFAGGFDLAAAISVAGTERSATADVVGRLTDKNLLIHQRTAAGSRWRMLEVVRSYARERLATSDDDAPVRDRYLRWASTVATELEHRLASGRPWRDEFDAVTGDLRIALSARPETAGHAEHRLPLALALARLHARRGAFTLAQGSYEEAMSMARDTSDPDVLAQAALGASASGMLFGVTRSSRVALLDEALAAQGDAPTATRARLLARLATELHWSTDWPRSRQLADEAVALAESLHDDGARAHALYALHYVSRRPAERHRQLALAERVTSYAELSGETQLELAGRAARCIGLLEIGDLKRMDAELDTLARVADERDHPEFQWYATVYRFVRALIAGRYDDSDELAIAATTATRHAPEFAIGFFFAEATTDLRDMDEFARRRRAARLAEMGERFPRVVVWRCLALLDGVILERPARAAVVPGDVDRYRLDGRRAQARAMCDELLGQDPPDDHWLVAGCLLAEAIAELADVEPATRSGPPDAGPPERPAGDLIHAADLARPLADALRPFAGRLAVAGRVAAFRGSVSEALGRLAAALGDTDEAVRRLGEATEQYEQFGAHAFHARASAALDRARATRPS